MSQAALTSITLRLSRCENLSPSHFFFLAWAFLLCCVKVRKHVISCFYFVFVFRCFVCRLFGLLYMFSHVHVLFYFVAHTPAVSYIMVRGRMPVYQIAR